MNVMEMQKEVRKWAIEKGWRGPNAPVRDFGSEIALLHSEASEALEAYRERGTNKWSTYSSMPLEQAVPLPINVDTRGEVTTDFDELGYGEHAKPEGVPSELADLFIRVLDMCEEYGWDLEAEFHRKMQYNYQRSFRHGGKRL